MMLRSLRKTVLAAALLMGGCGTATFIIQQYDGSPLPRERIALLRINGGEALRLESLDGERLNYQLKGLDTRVHIEMLPGVHEVGVSDPEDGLLQVRRFRAEPGKVYRPALVDAPQVSGRLATRLFALYEVSSDDDHVVAELPDTPEPTITPTSPPVTPASAAAPPPSAPASELPGAPASASAPTSASADVSNGQAPAVTASAAASSGPVTVPAATVPATVPSSP